MPCPLVPTDVYRSGLKDVATHHLAGFNRAIEFLREQAEFRTTNRFVLDPSRERLDWCEESLLGIDWEYRILGVYRVIYRVLHDGRGQCAEVLLLCIGGKLTSKARLLGKKMKKVSYSSVKKIIQGRISDALRAEIQAYDGTSRSMKKVLKWLGDAESVGVKIDPFMKLFMKQQRTLPPRKTA